MSAVEIDAGMLDLIQHGLDKLEPEVLAGHWGIAVVYFDLPDKPITMTDTTYWADEHTIVGFEDRAARRAMKLSATRYAFALAIIIADRDEETLMRPPFPDLPPRDFEELILYVLAVDLESGFEIGRVDVAVNGTVQFGNLRVLAGEHQMRTAAPGFRMLKALTA